MIKSEMITEIKKISLRKNDILVMRLGEHATMSDMNYYREMITDILKELNLNNKAILIPDYHEFDHIDGYIKKLKKFKEKSKKLKGEKNG